MTAFAASHRLCWNTRLSVRCSEGQINISDTFESRTRLFAPSTSAIKAIQIMSPSHATDKTTPFTLRGRGKRSKKRSATVPRGRLTYGGTPASTRHVAILEHSGAIVLRITASLLALFFVTVASAQAQIPPGGRLKAVATTKVIKIAYRSRSGEIVGVFKKWFDQIGLQMSPALRMTYGLGALAD